MTSEDLAKAREYLTRAEAWLSHLQGFPETPGHVAACAAIGAGYAALATAEGVQPKPIELIPSCSPLPPELQAAIRRSVQTADEARPHDDESAEDGHRG
jgi:hypothetical protein